MCFASATRLVPRRMRFAAALFVARMLEPFIRRTQAYRAPKKTRIDGTAEIAVSLVLHVLTKHGTAFDPVIDVTGYEAFASAIAEGHGLLVLSPHAALTLLIARNWYDDDLAPVIVSPDRLMRVPGTSTVVETVQPSPMFLLAIRTLLRRGRFVAGMPDRAVHHRERTREFETPNGPMIISPALMQVAVSSGAKVIFTEVHVANGILAATVREASSNTAEGITKEFVDFVRTRTDSRTAHQQAAVGPQRQRALAPPIRR